MTTGSENADIAGIDIRRLRLRLELTQEELARRLGVSVSTVSRWETRRTVPSRLAMGRLKEMLAGQVDE